MPSSAEDDLLSLQGLSLLRAFYSIEDVNIQKQIITWLEKSSEHVAAGRCEIIREQLTTIMNRM